MKSLLLIIFLICTFALLAETPNRAIEEPKGNSGGQNAKRSKRSIYIKISEKQNELNDIAYSYNIGTDSTECSIEVKFIVNKAGIAINSEIISNTCNNADFEEDVKDWLKSLKFKGLTSEDTTSFTYPFVFKRSI